ncbi:hypothetical protein HHI36_017751 [Cryptolaemus montrouzieri]|uniref:Centrobin n=1 Tax=Cryptolaemus montrouzieri TaxID=559131 RepID=A0ABD2NPF4_9CUCU
MSESDDTDELLLMPTQIEDNHISENFVPYYHIVDKLITQVSKLRSRITSIENSSDVSLGSITNSMDTLLNMRSSDSSNACRRCYSYESLPNHSELPRSSIPQCFSTQSTPQKPRSKLMLKSFPYSPSYDENLKQFKKPLHRSGVPRDKIEESHKYNQIGIHKQPLTEENNIIQEIDNFLSNVKPAAKNGAARSLEFDKFTNEYMEKQSRTLFDVQQILKEMDQQEEKIKNMYEDRTEKSSVVDSEKNEPRNTIEWKKGLETLSLTSSDSSLTDKSTVLYRPVSKKTENTRQTTNDKRLNITESRNNLVSQALGISQQDEKNKKDVDNRPSETSTGDMERTLAENLSSSSHFTRKSVSSPQFDVHSNAKDALLLHKKLLNETQSPEFGTSSSKKLIRPGSDPRLGSVSLVNLWSMGNSEPANNPDKCVQKLQEEKLRRTHCEELIQQLQNKILEQQEKLAVAIQVDEAKDTAIIRFHDAWEKATLKIKQVLKERDQLENDVANMASQNKNLSDECEERIEFHRKETNQALMMAQEHQKKSEILEQKLNDLATENETLKISAIELTKRLSNEEEKNKQLSNILANKEIELNESKNILLHAKKEVAQCQNAVEMCQKDFSTIKIEYDLIQEEIKTERLNVSQLHEQNKALHEELENQKKNEKALMENLKEAQDKVETNKKELRNFYQGQVELLVQTKLKEFQKQLDDAEHKMKDELSKKELEIAKAAAMHIQQINDKYSLEINLLEQKHQEEMQLKQVRTAQLEQKLHELQGKLDRQQDKRTELVKQLQKVMEAQWTEALRIINNGRSPVPQDDSSSTIDQLHSLHSKSYQNVEALLNQGFEVKHKTPHHNGNDVSHFNGHSDKKSNQKRNESLHHRGGKSKSMKPQEDDNLQRYINLLLHKQPGNPVESKEKPNSPRFFTEQPNQDRSIWQHADFKSDFPENDCQMEGNKKKTQWK